MKKIFLTLAKNSATTATLVFLLIAPFQPLIAQAQDAAGFNLNAQTPQDVINTSNAAAAQANQNSAAFQAQSAAAGTVGSTGSSPAQTAAANSTTGFPSVGCSLAPSTWDLCITSIVYVFTIGIGSGFAYIAAYFFDWTIALSLNGSAYGLDFVSQGWTTARDIANMAFLFILLYIAFKIIFEAETNDTVHMLTMVIVIALLVNFSFFFTRLAIDAGNILSIQFYNAIQAPSIASTAASQQSGVSGTLGNAANASSLFASNSKDLTASIMGMLNLQGLFNTQAFNNWYNQQKGAGGFLVVLISLSFLYIAAGIMFWLLTVAFVTNGVKFLFRIVILWFLIIAAPLAFVARAVPKFEKYYKEWQDALISHAFYPAAFMFIFLILTNFSNEMGNNNNLTNGLFNGLTAANSSGTSQVAAIAIVAANIFIRLGFVIAMLYIGMEAAKKIGIMGADAANHAGNWVGGRMIGAYGAAGRNTAGWAAYRTANSNWARKLESSSALFGVAGLAGRGIRGTLGTVGRASFDARGIAGTKNILKDAGKAQKGGFESAAKASVEAKEKKMKAVEPSEGQKELALAKAKADPTINYVATKKTHETEISESKDRIGEIDSRMEVLKTKVGDSPEGRAEGNKLMIEKRTRQAGMAMSTRALKALEETTLKKAKEISGEGRKYEYAKTLSTRNIRNLWIPFLSSRDAAAKIRKGDSKEKRVLDAAKKELKEIEDAEKKEAGETPTKEGESKEAETGHDEH